MSTALSMCPIWQLSVFNSVLITLTNKQKYSPQYIFSKKTELRENLHILKQIWRDRKC